MPRSIIVPSSGPNPIEVEDADYEGLISVLQEDGTAFELVADTEKIVGDPNAVLPPSTPEFLEFEPPPEELRRGAEAMKQATSGMPRIEGVSNRDYEDAYRKAYSAEMATRAEVEAIDTVALEKSVRRAANMTLTPPGEFLPAEATPMSIDTYKHFEPSISAAIDATTDEDDRAAMESQGEQSAAYRAYADQQWKLVHDVHEKHRLPVVRVNSLSESKTPGAGTASMLGSVTENVTVPLLLGFDQIALATAGKQAMGAAGSAVMGSVATQELERMGVIEDQVGRLEQLGEESPWVMAAGGIIALPTLLPSLIERGAAKIGGALSSKPLQSAAIAGATVTGVELGAEALVETGVEAVGGREATLPSEGDAIEMMLMGAGLGAGGHMIGSAGEAYQNWLRHPDTAGAADLNQLEALLSDVPRDVSKIRQGKPFRATSMTMSGGLNPGDVVREAKQRVATQRKRPREGVAETVEDIYIEPVEKLGKALEVEEKALRGSIANEAQAYHMSREGRRPVSTAPILARLEAMKAARSGGIREVSDPELAETMFADAAGGATSTTALPLVKTRMLDELISDFKNHPQMNAGQLDASLQELDDLVAGNKAAISNNRVLRDLSQSLREVRDEFMGNIHTKGGGRGGWSALKSQQADKLGALESSRDRMGLRNVAGTPDLPTQRKTAINAVKSLGADASSSEIYRVLNKNPKLKARLQQVMANEPHSRLMRGGTEAVVNRSTAARTILSSAKYRFDPVAEMLSQGLMGRGGAIGQLGAIGSGSEQAQAAADGLREDKHALLQMMDALRERAPDSPAQER